MKIKSLKFLIFCIATFVIVFLINYLGNAAQDKLSRALMNAAGGVVGLIVGMYIYNKNNKDTSGPQNFD